MASFSSTRFDSWPLGASVGKLAFSSESFPFSDSPVASVSDFLSCLGASELDSASAEVDGVASLLFTGFAPDVSSAVDLSCAGLELATSSVALGSIESAGATTFDCVVGSSSAETTCPAIVIPIRTEAAPTENLRIEKRCSL